MIHLCEILNSKLSPPRVSGTVARKRLEPFLSSILDNRITTVTAGAGFGKSTLIAQACDFIDCAKVWYRLEPDDSDPVTFINYLTAGIKSVFPDFGKRTLAILNSTNSIVEINNHILSIFIKEIEEITLNNFIIVLDDCHSLSSGEEITRVLQYLVDHLPEKVHLVMMSRNESFLQLSRLRTSLEINEIEQKDLEFTEDEVQDLFNRLSGSAISKNSIYSLHTRTEGWVSGLILFHHLSKGKNNDEIEVLLEKIKSSHKVFTDYLGENVFENQSGEIKSFLVQTSLFKQLDIDFCNRFLEIEHSGSILSYLENNYLFTTAIDSEERTYSYHNLFKEFLLEYLIQEKGESGVLALHERAARVYEEMARVEDALYHYLEARKFIEVFRLLETVGYRFFSQGRHTNLDKLLQKIPEQFLLKEPVTLALKARLLTSGGQMAKAVQYGKRAHDLYLQRNMTEEAERVLVDCGTSYYLMGDFSKAEEIFTEILAHNKVDDFTLFQILGNLIFTTSYFGKFDQADKYFEEAEKKLDKLEISMAFEKLLITRIWLRTNYGFRWHFYGDYAKSIVYAESVHHDIDELGSPPLRAYSNHLVSINQIFLGKIKDARCTVERGLSEVYGNGFLGNQEAWLRLNLAMVCMVEQNFQDAMTEIERGLLIFRNGGNRWGEGYFFVLLTILFEKLGQSEQSRQTVMEGLQLANSIKLPWVEGKLFSFAALSMINQKDFSQASIFLDKAEALLSYSQTEKCFIHLIRARFYSAQEEEEETIESLFKALKIGEPLLFGAWVFFGLDKLTEFYVKIYAMGKYKNYLATLFSSVPERYISELHQLKKHTNKKIKMAASEIIAQLPTPEKPSLKIQCFGRFKVSTGHNEIKNGDWKSNKAKEIFKYLVDSRHRGAVPRDVLLELLWPEEDFEKTVKRLHVALPALRKTLEPEVRRGESSYLVRENDLYRLNLGSDGEVDVDIFLAEIKSAEKETDIETKLPHLLNAEACYSGDYLAEDIYTEWCFEERENLKRKYLKVLEDIISIYKGSRKVEKCIVYSEKFLEADEYSEPVYLQLMQFYYDAGQKNLAIKTYEKCCKKIVDDLGCPISPDIEAFYDNVLMK